MILLVGAQVLGQLGDACREQSDLDFRRARVGGIASELIDQLCLALLGDRNLIPRRLRLLLLLRLSKLGSKVTAMARLWRSGTFERENHGDFATDTSWFCGTAPSASAGILAAPLAQFLPQTRDPLRLRLAVYLATSPRIVKRSRFSLVTSSQISTAVNACFEQTRMIELSLTSSLWHYLTPEVRERDACVAFGET